MATNKVVTVTAASVVTGDTLEGYNFYSDQEGATPLNGGTVVTPANAAAGQTYALTDGVVHSVTAKPVGVSNGEFSAVVSNAVSVDLSSTGTVPTFTLAGGTSTWVESPTNTFTDQAGDGAYDAFAVSTTTFSGDFDFRVDFDDATNHVSAMIGISTASGNVKWNDSGNEWLYGVYQSGSTTYMRQFASGTAGDPDIGSTTTPSFTAGDTLRLVRVGSNLKAYIDTTEIHNFGTISTSDMYVHFSTGSGKVIANPTVF
jgi:hypothetical protein